MSDRANSNLLTPAEVAKRLRVSRRTIYIWANNGTLPGYKLGGVWRFDSRAVTRFIKAGSNDRAVAAPHGDILDQAIAAWEENLRQR